MNEYPMLESAREVFAANIPTFFPDETLYSLFARADRSSGITDRCLTGQLFFGTRHAYRYHAAPLGLGHLAKVLPDRFGSPLRCLLTRTIASVYFRFMPQDSRLQAMKASIDWIGGRKAFAFRWLSYKQLHMHPLKFCSGCMEEDLRLGGAAYWHLAHQYPAVHWCVEHRLALQCVPREASSGWLLPSPNLVRPQTAAVSHADVEFGCQLATVLEGLRGTWPIDLKALRWFVAASLEETGVVRAAGSIKKDVLQRWVDSHMNDYRWGMLEPFASRASASLSVFTTGAVSHHPARWGMILTCLLREGIALSDILRAVDGPQCPELPGMPPCWQVAPPRAFDALSRGLSCDECAAELKVHRGLVRRWTNDPVLHEVWTTAKLRNVRDGHRQQVLDVLGSDPKLTRGSVRRMAPAAWQWLKKHEPDWLAQVAPYRPNGRQLELWPVRLAKRVPPEARKLLADGVPAQKCAEQLQVPVGRVFGWLRDQELNEQWTRSKVERYRTRYHAVVALLKQSIPVLTASRLKEHDQGAYEWLKRYEPEWLASQYTSGSRR